MKFNKSGKCRGIFKDDRAVSPVIAVILMVAITVVMAAIVSSWSSGVKAPTTPTTVGLDVSRNNNNITVVVTSIDPASSAPIPNINISYYTNGSTATKFYAEISSADVGNSKEIDTNSSELKLVTIVATFKDNSKKVLYSRET